MIAESSRGQNFRALGAYLAARARGLDRASTEIEPGAHRVAWRVARNVPTNDPELAASFMASTAQQNPRVQKPVYHLILSFDPHDPVTRSEMERIATRVLTRLELQDHQVIIVAHQDKAHPHMHLMINRVHPETLKAWDRSWDYRDIQQVLRHEERALGLREVPGRLYRLPGQELGPQLETRGQRHVQERGDPFFLDQIRGYANEFRAATSWQTLDIALASHGLSLQKQGRGLIVTDGRQYVKASSIARDLSSRHLEQRFGLSYDDWEREPLERQPSGHPSQGHPTAAELPSPPLTLATDIRTYSRILLSERDRFHVSEAVHQAESKVRFLEDGVKTARQYNRDFDDAFRHVYANPDAARQAYTRVVQTLGPATATKQLRETPEQFGVLQTVERKRALGLLIESDTTLARTWAHTAAQHAVTAHQWHGRAATPVDITEAHRSLDDAKARFNEVYTAGAGLPSVYSHEVTTLKARIASGLDRLDDVGRQHLSRLVSQAEFTLGNAVVKELRDQLLDRDRGMER